MSNADERAEACVSAAEQAQEMRSATRLRAARELLLQCAAPDCPAAVSSDCTQWLAEVEEALPSIVLLVQDSEGRDLVEVSVSIDGERVTDELDGLARPIDPGRHTFLYEAEGMHPLSQEILVAEGQKRRPVSVTLEPETPSEATDEGREPPEPQRTPEPVEGSRGRRIPAYVLGGTGVVALGSFAFFGIRGKSRANDLASGCGATKSCTEGQVRPVRRELIAADVSLAVGLVSVGTAVWMLVTHDEGRAARPPRRTAWVSPTIDGVTLEAQWTF
jgi:hypothetical protein